MQSTSWGHPNTQSFYPQLRTIAMQNNGPFQNTQDMVNSFASLSRSFDMCDEEDTGYQSPTFHEKYPEVMRKLEEQNSQAPLIDISQNYLRGQMLMTPVSKANPPLNTNIMDTKMPALPKNPPLDRYENINASCAMKPICNIGGTDLHAGLEPPHPTILSVLPPNISTSDFLSKAIAALQTPLGFKRDLSFILERYNNYLALNRGHTASVMVQTSRGTRTQMIKCWIDFVMFYTKKQDNLPVHFPEKTLVNSKTACNSFNSFWANLHKLGSLEETPDLFQLRSSFYDADEGVLCLASMSHTHRALCFAHFAHKALNKEQDAVLTGGSKKNYLDAVMRFLKAYEVLYELEHIYDTDRWSWATSWQYRQVCSGNRFFIYYFSFVFTQLIVQHEHLQVFPTLKVTTKLNQTGLPASKKHGKNYGHHMTDEQFAQLNHFTFKLAQEQYNTNFREYLLIMQAWWIQIFLVFCCPRGGVEVWELESREIEHTGLHRLTYTPLNVLKNTTVSSSMQVITKDSIDMVGQEVCNFFDLMVSKAQQGWDGCNRLFHQPKENPRPEDQFWFQKDVHGKSFTNVAVSKYAGLLKLLDPSFPRMKFTNGSVRKCHTYILNTSNLPASVQQKSLGHVSFRSGGSNLWRTTYNNPADSQIR